MNSWSEYFINTKNKPPRTLLVQSLVYVHKKDKALDLGAGALNDSLYLLAQGFEHVTALDKEPLAQEIADGIPKDSFSYIISNLENYVFSKNIFNLINAQYTLPFVLPHSFDYVWDGIYESLKQGGVLTGQLFGHNDEWVSRKEMNFHTKEKVEKLLEHFDILFFNEEETDSRTAAGNMKHWHVFNFILRKK